MLNQQTLESTSRSRKPEAENDNYITKETTVTLPKSHSNKLRHELKLCQCNRFARERKQNAQKYRETCHKERENLDLREETMVAARPEELVHSIVGSVGGIVVMAGGAADGRTTAGDVGAAVAH